MDQDTKKILQRLEALCSRREYCSRDIYRKALERCGGDIQKADEILESLKAERFVDDLRYASAFAREKSSLSGWGELKLRTALLAKGIPEALIREAIEEIDPERADHRLERLMEKKWASLSDDPQGKLKLLRYALGRGYLYEQVKPLVDKLTKGSVSDDI